MKEPKIAIKSFKKEDLPELLSPKFAASIMGVSPRSVCDLCRAGYIKAEKYGVKWRVERDALIEQFDLLS